ncbi:unnamed protein product, partial [Ectocarpus fasciculatus]
LSSLRSRSSLAHTLTLLSCARLVSPAHTRPSANQLWLELQSEPQGTPIVPSSFDDQGVLRDSSGASSVVPKTHACHKHRSSIADRAAAPVRATSSHHQQQQQQQQHLGFDGDDHPRGLRGLRRWRLQDFRREGDGEVQERGGGRLR